VCVWGGGGGLVASWCIFIPITTLLDHRNTATTKKLDFKNSHITSVGAIYSDMRPHFRRCPASASSQVKLILSPMQRAKPKTSARKTGRSMPHCVARWVWLLRVLRSGGERVAWPSVCSRRAELVTRGRPFVQFHAS
jgi:hypothetical protein